MKILITENQLKRLIEQQDKQEITLPVFGKINLNELELYSQKNNFIKVNIDKQGNLTLLEKPGFKGIVNNEGTGFITKFNLNKYNIFPKDISSSIKTKGGGIPIIPYIQKKDENSIIITSLQLNFVENRLNKKIEEGDFIIKIGDGYPFTDKYNGKVVPSINAIPNGDLMIYAKEFESKSIGGGIPPDKPRIPNLPKIGDMGDLFKDNKSYIDINSDKYKDFIQKIKKYIELGGTVSKIIITSSASKFNAGCCDDDSIDWSKYKKENDPTGNNDAPNYKLTVARSQHTKDVLQKSLGGKDSLYELRSLGSNGPIPKKGEKSNDEKFAKHRYVTIEIKP
jgi:hypothetical protein